MGCDALFKYIQHIAGLTSDNTVERNNVRSYQCIGLNGPYKISELFDRWARCLSSPNTQVTQKKKSQFSQQESNQWPTGQ